MKKSFRAIPYKLNLNIVLPSCCRVIMQMQKCRTSLLFLCIVVFTVGCQETSRDTTGAAYPENAYGVLANSQGWPIPRSVKVCPQTWLLQRTRVQLSIFEWIESWYNRRRRHSTSSIINKEFERNNHILKNTTQLN